MINETFGNAILKALFGQGTLGQNSTSNGSNYQAVDQGLGKLCYMGLMTNRDQSQSLQADKTYPAFSDASHLPEEIIDSQYERKCLGNLQYPVVNLMDAPSGCKISNKNEFINFNEIDPESDIKHVVTHIGLFSAKTGGSAVYIGKLNEPVEVTKNQNVIFRKGKVNLSMGTDDVE